MKTFRVVLAVLVAAPSTALAQKVAESKARSAKTRGPSSSSSGDTGAAAPLSPNPTPVSLPSYSGPSSPTYSAGGMAPMCGPVERQELDKITSLNMIEVQKYAQRLRPVNEEREDAAARYNALYEKQKLELAPLEYSLKRMQIEASLADEKFKKELADMRQLREKLHLENDLAREKLAADQLKADADKLKMDVAIRDLDFQSRKLRADAELEDHKTVALKADLDLRAKKEAWKKEANRDPEYPLEPYKDGVLTISDRRITLDGPIFYGVADYVTERIHYYNNKDEKLPIFIVIDSSPGGSVMEGYRIVKAMQASKAPVHVVVKSFAASMAAVITTLAPRSYVYPNAIVLHHQIRSFMGGNLTQQKEQLEILKEWYKRLAAPVAKKVGYGLDGWTKEMYKHSSDGDWQEFGDEAVRLKWADRVVHEVRETGFVKDPDEVKDDAKGKKAFALAASVDAQGRETMRLPRLQPFDAYWIYNPDQYYR
ncbi:MAG: ATP-dependent Clp protease proteolytic subunit [Elusimicrobia bacterium]|nr:ATP-dependent Clp protease proteolytic subunit [Elusimicrobiota bacterium]